MAAADPGLFPVCCSKVPIVPPSVVPPVVTVKVPAPFEVRVAAAAASPASLPRRGVSALM